MPSNTVSLAVGKSQVFNCSYLSEQQEQLLVVQESGLNAALFEQLMALGFRRSGSRVYRPDCPHCQACLPIRLPVQHFAPSKRQKRTLKMNLDLRWQITEQHTDQHYALYEKYINARHQDGGMYPPSTKQYQDFVACDWLPSMLLEIYLQQQLIAVAITDPLPNSLSAVYSFFDPDEHKRSLGSQLILLQCEIAKMMGKDFLYLGYQIDKSKKMSYKKNYKPHQILTSSGWQSSTP